MASYANQVSFVKNRYKLIGTIINANVPSISHSGIDISPITIIIKLSSFCLILLSSLSFIVIIFVDSLLLIFDGFLKLHTKSRHKLIKSKREELK